MSIAPGGLREAIFSENYSVLWKNRIGFAKAALEAEVVCLTFYFMIMCASCLLLVESDHFESICN